MSHWEVLPRWGSVGGPKKGLGVALCYLSWNEFSQIHKNSGKLIRCIFCYVESGYDIHFPPNVPHFAPFDFKIGQFREYLKLTVHKNKMQF